MAHRFVQQHAGPARAQHHRQRAGGRVFGLQADQGLAQGFGGDFARLAVGEQVFVGITAAGAGVTLFAAAALFDDHLHVEAHQRPHVGGDHAVAARHQHRVHAAGKTDDDLLHARVGVAQPLVDFAQGADLGVGAEAFDRINGRVQRTARHDHAVAGGLGAAVAADRARRRRRLQQRFGADVVGIGEAGFFAADRTHAHALFDGVGAVLDDAVLDHPAFAA